MRKIRITHYAFPLMLLLSGCAVTPSPELEAKRAQLEKTTPVCIDEADCKTKWEAAQLWVVHNSGYKIQTATDVLIETYNSTQSDTDIAVRVTKEPLGGGKYKLVVSVWCDNMFGCTPNQWDAALDFNQKVAAASP